VRARIETDTRTRDLFLHTLLERSSLAKAKLVKCRTAKESLSELDQVVHRLIELKTNDQVCGELKDHVIDLYSRVIAGILKRES
jgi:hypothetical protein